MGQACGDCLIWIGSSEVDRFDRRWCAYSGRYEESNQKAYGCMGYVYNCQAVLTKVCEILRLDAGAWLKAFDAVKETYALPCQMEWLTPFCGIGPIIAEEIDQDEKREEKAQIILSGYMEPAELLWREGKIAQAAAWYKQMMEDLTSKDRMHQ